MFSKPLSLIKSVRDDVGYYRPVALGVCLNKDKPTVMMEPNTVLANMGLNADMMSMLTLSQC